MLACLMMLAWPGAEPAYGAELPHGMESAYGTELPHGMDAAYGAESAFRGLQGEDWGELDRFLQAGDGAEQNISFTELARLLWEGRGQEAGRMILDAARQGLLGQIGQSWDMALQLLMLGLIGAVFANFSEIFSGGQMSETGFFMTYLMAFAVLASGFSKSAEAVGEVLARQAAFMKVLMPAYAAAAAWSGAAVTSAAWYEVVLFLIAAVQQLYLKALLPGIRIYLLLILAGHMMKERMLFTMTGLLRSGLRWGLRSLMGIVIGFQLIQGMVLPYADAVRTAGVQRLLQAIPGVGAGAGAVTKLVLGSGVLIKNTVGAAAVVILALISLVPLIRLGVVLLMYRLAAAALEPVADRRLTACINGAADGQKLLLELAASALLLFAVTIALICAGTNAVYLA